MLNVSEARTRILNAIIPVGTTRLPLHCLSRRVLAGDIIAPIDIPSFDNSSVDGFAVRSADIAGAGPVSPRYLEVVADIHAGSSSTIPLAVGQCARIMTGAPIPPGSDAVVMIEDTDVGLLPPGTSAPQTVAIYNPIQNGQNIRRRGEDLHAGEKVLLSGTRLYAGEVALLAMLGIPEAPVYRLPRVALISGGDELLPVEAPLEPGKIHESNSFMLAALCESAGVELIPLGIASDSEKDIRSRLEQAVFQHADLIISSAGISVGAFDYIKPIIETDGRLDFWKVNMRPGKPLAFGSFHEIPFFGLPGNPVSAFVCFEVFVRPALEKLSGQTPRPHPYQKARLAEPVASDGRETYLRAVVTGEYGHWVARLTGHQGSGNILSLVQANALLIVPSGVKSLPANSEVDIWFIK